MSEVMNRDIQSTTPSEQKRHTTNTRGNTLPPGARYMARTRRGQQKEHAQDVEGRKNTHNETRRNTLPPTTITPKSKILKKQDPQTRGKTQRADNNETSNTHQNTHPIEAISTARGLPRILLARRPAGNLTTNDFTRAWSAGVTYCTVRNTDMGITSMFGQECCARLYVRVWPGILNHSLQRCLAKSSCWVQKWAQEPHRAPKFSLTVGTGGTSAAL